MIIFFFKFRTLIPFLLYSSILHFWEDGFARILPVAEDFVARNDIILHVRVHYMPLCQTGIHMVSCPCISMDAYPVLRLRFNFSSSLLVNFHLDFFFLLNYVY